MPTVEIVYVDDEMDTLEYEYEAATAEGCLAFINITHPFEAEKFRVNMLHVRSITYYKDEASEEAVV